jgi:hypothetical protein
LDDILAVAVIDSVLGVKREDSASALQTIELLRDWKFRSAPIALPNTVAKSAGPDGS